MAASSLIRRCRVVRVHRNIRYSDDHERNVLDIYEPIEYSIAAAPFAPSTLDGHGRQQQQQQGQGQGTEKEKEERHRHEKQSNLCDGTTVGGCSRGTRPPLPTLLFVHGGMWMRGSKDQNVLSPWDAIRSSLLGLLFDRGDEGGGVSGGAEAEVGRRPRRPRRATTAADTNTTTIPHPPSYSSSSSSSFHDLGISKVGATVAYHGGIALVMNYRLAVSDESFAHADVGSGQVMDVARAIAFAVERYSSTTTTTTRPYGCHSRASYAPNVFVCGHSAGAHLAALALCHNRYLPAALEERRINNAELVWSDLPPPPPQQQQQPVVAGFVGISGVYNLRRLGMSALRDIVVGPAFLSSSSSSSLSSRRRRDATSFGARAKDYGGYSNNSKKAEEEEDILADHSPVHVLLRAHSDCSLRNLSDETRFAGPRSSLPPPPPLRLPPFLARMPVLLLNAESDFHLERDAEELQVALGQFDDCYDHDHDGDDGGCSVRNGAHKKVERATIASTDHFSILGQFGSALNLRADSHDTILVQNRNDDCGGGDGWNVVSIGSQYRQVADYAASLFGIGTIGNERDQDETLNRILLFMGLIDRKNERS